YELGEGINKDEKKAFELIKQLAEKEDPNAQHKLGYYYEKGIGTEIDIKKAVELYQIAADSNKCNQAVKSLDDLLFLINKMFKLGVDHHHYHHHHHHHHHYHHLHP